MVSNKDKALPVGNIVLSVYYTAWLIYGIVVFGPTVVGFVKDRVHTEQAIATAAAVSFKSAPHLGAVEVGIFSPEVGERENIDVTLYSLERPESFERYHTAIRDVYGADLADFNYFSLGSQDWLQHALAARSWIVNASQYGDPTIALEPDPKRGYAAFHDGPEMQMLRSVFADEQRQGINVWVRFCSECNLSNSSYSVVKKNSRFRAYKRAARWFRGYMPSNVKMVFCPLINTAYEQSPAQLHVLQDLYEPGIYDRIGGTLYATPNCNPINAYDWYYNYMSQLDENTPFQICEYEGTLKLKSMSISFLNCVRDGRWPKLKRINLFAGPINQIAEDKYTTFGWVENGSKTSFLKSYFGS